MRARNTLDARWQFRATLIRGTDVALHFASRVATARSRQKHRYTGVPAAPRTASLDTAIAHAAHDTLAAMFPSQASSFGQLLAEDVVQAAPPFPSCPSGHAGFGGALFQVLRRFYGTDNMPFTFVSDELNGETVANDGTVRPLVPRSFRSFSQAEEENGQSRIYLGIHWDFDKTQGIPQGRRVGNYVFDNAFQPLR